MIVIGRGEGSEVRLPDPSVSHRHATIRQRGSDYILVDEGSTNGTFMGGVKLGAHAPRILKHKDMARVGRVWLELRFDAGIAPAQTALATRELALALVARALDAQGELGGPLLRVVGGPDTGKTLELGQAGKAYVLGRGQEADLVLEDVDASRRHVQVLRRADQVLVRDLGSKNGAEIGNERLGERDRTWKPGEELRVGRNTVVYEHAAIAALVELEGVADERIRPDEPLSPPDLDAPVVPAAGTRLSSGSERVLSAPVAEAMGMEAEPITRAPARRRGARLGWTGTDLVVVLLAVSVLALSIFGLVWLLRG